MLMQDIHVDLGNIDLLINILRDNIELCLEIPEEKLYYFIDMIVEHGQEAVFIQIFDVLVSHEQTGIKQLQKKVLNILLKSKYKDLIDPFKKQATNMVNFSHN